METSLIGVLKEKKIKLTQERKAILQVLEKSSLPLSPFDLYKSLSKSDNKINLTTVYRNLEMLEGLSLVKRLGYDRNSFNYELAVNRPHHHHVVCNKCGKVEDLTSFSEKFDQEVTKKTAFKIEGHNLEFTGRCPACLKGSNSE